MVGKPVLLDSGFQYTGGLNIKSNILYPNLQIPDSQVTEPWLGMVLVRLFTKILVFDVAPIVSEVHREGEWITPSCIRVWRI